MVGGDEATEAGEMGKRGEIVSRVSLPGTRFPVAFAAFVA